MAGNPPKRKMFPLEHALASCAVEGLGPPALVKTVENGKVVYSRPHQAKIATTRGHRAVPRSQGPQGR